MLACADIARAQNPRDTTRRTPPDTATLDSLIRAARAAADTSDGSLGPFVLPGIFYTPETGIGAGLGALWVKGNRDHVTRPSNYSVNAVATRNGQFTLALSADTWTPKNEWHLTFDGLLSKYPYRFYGVGAASVDSGETYTPSTRIVSLTAQRALLPGIYAGLRLSYDDVLVESVAAGSQLSATTGHDGWKLVTLGVMANRDTRDRLYWPSTGTFASASLSRALGRLGSTHPFNRLALDVRRYITITGEHILATQWWGDFTDGLVPFDRLPQLGGQVIARGFLVGRFRDQQAMAMQAEYRSAPFAFIETVPRLTVVAFAGAAATAPVIGQFAGDRTRITGGFGLRYALSLPDRFNLRVDYGFGRDSRAFSITVGEAF